MRKILHLTSALLIVSLAAGCATSSKGGDRKASGLSSYDRREREVGRQIHEEVVSSFYLYTEPQLLEYVDQIGSLMAKQARRKDLSYKFTVLLDEKIFATSAPGGYIYITTGFLNFLENEAELAAVLGHEIGQLQYRNPKLSTSKKALEKLTTGGVMVGGLFGDIGVLAAMGLKAIDALTDEKSKEDRTYVADRYVLSYLATAGYDPQSWMDVLFRLVSLKEKKVYYIFDYYTARPMTPKRLWNLKNHFVNLDLKSKTFRTNTQEFLHSTKGVREIYSAGLAPV